MNLLLGVSDRVILALHVDAEHFSSRGKGFRQGTDANAIISHLRKYKESERSLQEITAVAQEAESCDDTVQVSE